MNEENTKAVESYLNALKNKDLSRAPLAEEMIFENPLAGRGCSAENSRHF